MVGDLRTGHIVVPYAKKLHAELDARCKDTGCDASRWVHVFEARFSPDEPTPTR